MIAWYSRARSSLRLSIRWSRVIEPAAWEDFFPAFMGVAVSGTVDFGAAPTCKRHAPALVPSPGHAGFSRAAGWSNHAAPPGAYGLCFGRPRTVARAHSERESGGGGKRGEIWGR